MMTYWTNFAVSGNPNWPAQTPMDWPRYAPGMANNTLILDTVLAYASSWDAENCEKWGSFFN
jgi:carboxylesterase type B